MNATKTYGQWSPFLRDVASLTCDCPRCFANPQFSVVGKQIYFTGTCGFLGRIWADGLRQGGALIRAFDLASPGSFSCDVRNRSDVERLFAYYQNDSRSVYGAGQFGAPQPPDALICAAAIDARPDTIGYDHPASDWDEIIATNLTGVMNCCEVIGQAMADSGKGSIVLVSSMYGLVAPESRRYTKGFVKPAAYGASKAALLNLTKYLATYWGPYGVRVNAICFGAVDRQEYTPRFRRSMEKAIPLGRMAKPEEWLGPLQFLLSDASSYMTGATLVVDGGYTAW